MARQSVNLAGLFADIARSAHLYKVLGDKKTKALIGGAISTLSEVTEQFHGSVIKTLGDEIM